MERPFHWATLDTPQSRSLLEGETVVFVRFVGGRDPLNLMSNAPAARPMIRDVELRAVVSTGSSMALPFFALARARGLRCHYIESAARSDGPSVTGRLMSLIPGVFVYSQYTSWADGRVALRGSVFDSFLAETLREPAPQRLARVW